MDLCGSMEDLPKVQRYGVHGSGLTLDFRSNRINTGEGFFLALTCTRPLAARKKRFSDSPTLDPSTDEVLVVIRPTACTPSQNLTAKVGRESMDEPLKTAEEYFVRY